MIRGEVNASGRESVPGGVLVLAVLLAACTPMMENGVYAGQTQKFGDVRFSILDGQLFGSFRIAAWSDCKTYTASYSLRNVNLEDGSITTDMSGEDSIEITGENDHDNSFDGQYRMYHETKGETCTAHGNWWAKKEQGMGEGNSSCLCRCRCSGCTFEQSKFCPEGGRPSDRRSLDRPLARLQRCGVSE